MPKAKIVVTRVNPDSVQRYFRIEYTINYSKLYEGLPAPTKRGPNSGHSRRNKSFYAKRNKILKTTEFKQFGRARSVAEKLAKVKGIKKVYIIEKWAIPDDTKN